MMTHAVVPVEANRKLKITTSLIRFSIGQEDAVDLIADISQALEEAFNQETKAIKIGGDDIYNVLACQRITLKKLR